jgi:flavin reductase (DIM6/NTAB) family NADH-FMN oxidoreductase RutF
MKDFLQVDPSVGHRLLAPRVAYLVGTTGPQGPNLIPASNVTSVSREPQILVIGIYKEWQTYRNLVEASGFTLCLPNIEQIDAVWKLAAKYSGFEPPDGKSKLEACGAEIDLDASGFGPVLVESVGWLECTIVHEAKIESDHGIFFGEVKRACFDPEFLTSDGSYRKNSKPVMQVVKNSFSTSVDHWEIPYLKKDH